MQGVKKRCRLSWLTNSALVYEPKCGGGGGDAISKPMSIQLCTRRPNKVWRSNSIFNLWLCTRTRICIFYSRYPNTIASRLQPILILLLIDGPIPSFSLGERGGIRVDVTYLKMPMLFVVAFIVTSSKPLAHPHLWQLVCPSYFFSLSLSSLCVPKLSLMVWSAGLSQF